MEKKDAKAKAEAKLTALKAKACDGFTQDLRLKSAIQQNATALQETLNQIQLLEKEK